MHALPSNNTCRLANVQDAFQLSPCNIVPPECACMITDGSLIVMHRSGAVMHAHRCALTAGFDGGHPARVSPWCLLQCRLSHTVACALKA
jgi:hypothetical protein